MGSGPSIYAAIPIQDKAVDAFLEMNRLLTTLATTLLGAMGLLLFGGFKGRPCSRELWAVIAGAISICLSIYYGYVAYLAVISPDEVFACKSYVTNLAFVAGHEPLRAEQGLSPACKRRYCRNARYCVRCCTSARRP
jgi:hypothetical protein